MVQSKYPFALRQCSLGHGRVTDKVVSLSSPGWFRANKRIDVKGEIRLPSQPHSASGCEKELLTSEEIRK